MNLYIFIGLIVFFLVVGWLATTIVKSQWIRIGDVLLLGPFLIWAATQVEQWWAKALLIAFGAATISYKACIWLHENRQKNSATSHPASWT